MPPLRMQRSSSSSSLKLWESRTLSFERHLFHANTMRTMEEKRLMDQKLSRSDADALATSKRRSFQRRGSNRSIGKQNLHYKQLFPEEPLPDYFVPGSSFPIPNDEGIEAVLPPRTPKPKGTTAMTPSRPPRHANKKNKRKQQEQEQHVQQHQDVHHKHQLPTQYSDFPRRPRWSCLPSAGSNIEHVYYDGRSEAVQQQLQSVPPGITLSSSSDDSRQERFDQSFELVHVTPTRPQQPDYAFHANVWASAGNMSSGGGVNTYITPEKIKNNTSLESNVDTTLATYSSASSSSSPHPEPVVLNVQQQEDEEENKKKKKPKKWKQRLFFWKNNKSKRIQRSLSLDSSSNKKSPNNRGRELSSTRRESWQVNDSIDNDIDNNIAEPAMTWDTNNGGDLEVECEYRGDVSVKDWFDNRSDGFSVRNKSPFSAAAPGNKKSSTLVDLDDTLSEATELPPTPANKKRSSLVDLDDTLSVATEFPPTSPVPPGVMELGQYAREMQSKSASKKQETPPLPKRRVKLTPSLLCALPSFGGSSSSIHKRSRSYTRAEDINNNIMDDDDIANFPDPDFGDPEGSEDDNSYLAVSYTGDGAQLVMQQSEDLTNDFSKSLEADDDGDDGIVDYEEQQQPPVSSLESSPQGLVGHDDMGYEEEDNLDRDPAVDDLLFDESESYMENDLQLLAQLSIRSASQKSLGASFPHPAAQLRDNLTQHQLRHPSSLLGYVDAETSKTRGTTTRNILRNDFKNDAGSRGTKSHPTANQENEVSGNFAYAYNQYKPKDGVEHSRSGRVSAASSQRTPPPIRTMRANMVPGLNLLNQEPTVSDGEPWVPRRRDDPSVPDGPRTSSSGFCPTDPPGSRYAGCTARGLPRWDLSQTTDLSTWDQSTTRTMSTISYSGMYPVQDRMRGWREAHSMKEMHSGQDNGWKLYQPIRTLAKGVNETFCENLYPRVEQPASVPFDEMEMDDRVGPRHRAQINRSQSSQSSLSSSHLGQQDVGGIRPQRVRSSQGLHPAPSSLEERIIDPPSVPSVSVLTAASDTRRQLL